MARLQEWLPLALASAYLAALAVAGVAPADRAAWLLTSILPSVFVLSLTLTHRRFRLSDTSYLLIAVFLGMHTVGSHYTYSHVPLGIWANDALRLGRNPFDRVVHFAFGLLLTYPTMELFARVVRQGRILVAYLGIMTCLGLSGLWEILEAWVAQLLSPELGAAYLGSQGDVWDAQNDIAVALLGAIVCVALTAVSRRWPGPLKPASRTAARSTDHR